MKAGRLEHEKDPAGQMKRWAEHRVQMAGVRRWAKEVRIPTRLHQLVASWHRQE